MKRAVLTIAALVCLMAVLGALPLLSVSCRKHSGEWQGTVERRGGITIVKNPAKPLYKPGILRLEKDLSIGRAEGEGVYAFSRIGGIDVDAEGRIYVLERGDAAVRVFDPNGVYMRNIGRKGQGPGETEMPAYVHITAQDEVYVYDLSTLRSVIYALDGTFVRQKSAGQLALPVAMDSRGNLLAAYAMAPPPLGGKLLQRFDPDFRFATVIARGEQGSDKVFDIIRPTCFACVTPADAIVWGHSKEYVLHVLDPDGRLMRRIEKTYDPPKITSEDKARYREAYADAVRRGFRLKFYDHFPCFSGLFADDGGRIFVKTYERIERTAEDTYYDVFDADGKYIAKLALRVDLSAGSVWKKHKLYAVESDAKGFPVINRYDVSWMR